MTTQTKQYGVDFPAATLPLTGTETLSLVQGGITVDGTAQDIANLAPGAGNMADSTIKGRAAGAGTGAPQDLTGAQVAVITQGAGLDVDATGFRGIPINSQSGNYTAVAADSGKMLLHPSGAGAGDTFTIPANASVAFELGTAITFCNMDSNSLAIASASDTLRREGTGATGSRTLAQYATATAVKVGTTEWLISGGSGLT